jgi:hypothetical protein
MVEMPAANAGTPPPPPTPPTPPPPPPPIILPPPPPPILPPPPPPPPPPPQPMFIPPPLPPTNFNPLLPIDVTKVAPNPATVLNVPGGPDPTSGITEIKDFPDTKNLTGPSDFILVQGNPTDYTRDSPYVATLLHGTVLVSVKKPSQLGIMNTPLGEVSFSSNSDAFITYENGVLRVRNIDGLGATIKIHLDKGPFAGNEHTYTIAPGFELVVADHTLTRDDLRPADGILRRKSQVLNDGLLAISQFQVENALQQSAIVSQMTQNEGDAKIKHVLSDMSHMAAVLNHVNGYDGYAH